MSQAYPTQSDEASGTPPDRIQELRERIESGAYPTPAQEDAAIERLIDAVNVELGGEVRAEARISDVQVCPPILCRDLDDERFDFFLQ